ncbi:hypothetical protein [Kineosporia sp. A_224]|uniref:hypothetical protein n=1 Tax=Kineosporia sp. A_224 TaxID=1962180 RepID=UPI000B4BFA4E|nr:hypothetical protein [Kineosporia sp. A_224]
MAVLLGTAGAVLALGACGSAGSGSAASSATTPAAPTSSASAVTSSAAPSTPVSPPSPSRTASPSKTPATAEPVARPVLVLESDGLGYVVGDAAIRHLPFGSDGTAVVTAVGTALGGSLTRNDLPECGQGPRTGAGRAGFSVLLDGTKFVGWTDQGAKGRHLTTADGLGIGSTLRDIKAGRPGTTTSEGSVGTEFIDGDGFGGILGGASLTSRATLVYAGETCFFR